MDILASVAQGLGVALLPVNLLYCFIGVFIGTLVGVLPGIGPVTAMSLLLPVTLVVVVFSVIQTFSDFQLIYVLTGGGPANSTHLMATYAYSLSMGAGQMGLGSAVALSMVPVLGLLLVWLTVYVRKD